jgi:hypothetical protein
MLATDILGLNDLSTKSIKVNAWNNRLIRIRELDLDMGIKIFEKVLGDEVVMSAEDIAAVVVYGVVDKDNNPIFTDEHIPELIRKSRNAMMFIYSEVMALSGTAEDAGKNSRASQR